MVTINKTFDKLIAYELVTYDLIDDGESLSVNDVYKTGIEVELSELMTDRDIINELKQLGVINLQAQYKSYDIDGDFEYVLYINFKGDPCCELRRAE